MASLADKMQSRHLDEASESSHGTQAASPGLGSVSADLPSTDSTPFSTTGHAEGATLTAEDFQSIVKKPTVDLSALPQLKGSSPRSAGGPRKWGPSTLDSPASGNPLLNSSGSTSSPSGSDGESPAISRMSTPQGQRTPQTHSVITVSLDTPSDANLVSQAVRGVSRTKKVVIEVSKAPVPNKATFMIKGASPQTLESARALLEISLAPKVVTEVSIPASSRSALIGVRGANLRAIERKYGVTIELSSGSSQWTMGRTVVTIEGNSVGVKDATRTIFEVVDNSRQVASSRDFPLKMHQFLLASKEWGSFVNRKNPRITLQGNNSEVTKGMASVDKQLAEWESTYETLEFPESEATEVSRTIEAPTDLVFAETGVVVLPRNAVYGPAKSLPEAMRRVKDYLASQSSLTLDISQAHDRDLAHARLLSRFFAANKVLDRIATDYQITVTGPNLETGGVVYTISGEDRNATLARKELVKEVNLHSPTSMAVVRGMRYPLVRKQAESALKTLKGPVSGFVGPSDELFLRFSEPEDDFTPQASDIRRHLDEAVTQLAFLSDLAKSIVRKSVKLGENNATLAVKPLGPEAKKLFDEKIGCHKDVDLEVEDSATVSVSGLKPSVAEAVEALPRIIQLSRTHALRASHVEEFNVDPSIVGNLIGRQGSQIRNMRSNYDVKMEVDESGHVRIQGVEAQAKACAKEILEIQRRWRDETTENLVIPAIYHKKLIGTKGKHVRRLRDQHQCIIRFPRTRQGSVDSFSDDDVTTTGASVNDDEDVILIKGPSRGVAAIKKEFLELVAYERSQSYTETFKIKASVVPKVVGRGGVAVNSIRNNTGTNINIGTPAPTTNKNGASSSGGDRKEEDDDEEEVEIVITGERKGVESAASQIRKAAEAALDTTEITLEVDPELHRLLIGPQNVTRRELVAEAGGDPELAGRTLVVGVNGHESPLVRIVAPSAVAAKLQTKVLEIVEDAKRKLQASGQLSFPRNRLRFVLGVGGAKRRELEEKYDVNIQIPKDAPPSKANKSSGNEIVTITVHGESERVVKEVLEVLRKLVLPAELILQIASPSWSPKLRNAVQSQFGVRMEVTSASSLTTTTTITEPSMPEDGSDWAVKTVDTKITVQLMGENQEACEKAAKYLEEHGNANTFGYLWIPQSKHRSIIGAGGKTINKLRNQSKTSIEVPASYSSSGKPIVIIGNAEQVEMAKSLLLETAVQN